MRQAPSSHISLVEIGKGLRFCSRSPFLLYRLPAYVAFLIRSLLRIYAFTTAFLAGFTMLP
jgi:hypothetical protein